MEINTHTHGHKDYKRTETEIHLKISIFKAYAQGDKFS